MSVTSSTRPKVLATCQSEPSGSESERGSERAWERESVGARERGSESVGSGAFARAQVQISRCDDGGGELGRRSVALTPPRHPHALALPDLCRDRAAARDGLPMERGTTCVMLDRSLTVCSCLGARASVSELRELP